MQSNEVLEALYQTIIDRREQPKEGSYTCYLFEKGLDKILKKNKKTQASYLESLNNLTYLNDNAVVKKATANVKINRDYVDYYVSPDGDDGQRRDPALRCPGGIGQAQ